MLPPQQRDDLAFLPMPLPLLFLLPARAAHEHSYERNYPVYQSMWNPNITGAAAYVNFDRPIHILSGAAGCPENQDPWQPTGNPFSALRLNVYGYGRLQVRALAV